MRSAVAVLFALILGASPAMSVNPEGEDPNDNEAGAYREPGRCPFDFHSDMPEGTFCVYRGVARDAEGEVCGRDVVVIWSSSAAKARFEDASGAGAGPVGGVFFGFISAPELVLRAVPDPQDAGRAGMVGFSSSDRVARPLAGETRLRPLPNAGSGPADSLALTVERPTRIGDSGCDFARYDGAFMGVVGLPRDGQKYVESD